MLPMKEIGHATAWKLLKEEPAFCLAAAGLLLDGNAEREVSKLSGSSFVAFVSRLDKYGTTSRDSRNSSGD